MTGPRIEPRPTTDVWIRGNHGTVIRASAVIAIQLDFSGYLAAQTTISSEDGAVTFRLTEKSTWDDRSDRDDTDLPLRLARRITEATTGEWPGPIEIDQREHPFRVVFSSFDDAS